MHGLYRHQRFIHSVGGFKKLIDRYINEANINEANSQFHCKMRLL